MEVDSDRSSNSYLSFFGHNFTYVIIFVPLCMYLFLFSYFIRWLIFLCGSTLPDVDKCFLGKQQRNGQFLGLIYKGKTTWKAQFLQSSTQREKWLNGSLFIFPPRSQYVGTNVPVIRTMDHTEVRRQREDFQHKQHNYLPHMYAHTPDMWRPVKQREAIQSCF